MFRVANSHNLPVDEMLKNLQEKLQNDIQDIRNELKNIPEMEEKCKNIKNNQMTISEHLDEIMRMQKMIGNHLLTMNHQNFLNNKN